MKNILIVFTVLAMATVANAGLRISVNGAVGGDPVVLKPSETAVIDIHAVDQAAAIGGWLLIQGPGAIDAGNPTGLWEQSVANNMPDPPLSEMIAQFEAFGFPGVVDIIEMEVKDIIDPITSPPNAAVIDGLLFHCEELGDVTLTLLDSSSFAMLDQVVIKQIPEPMTLALLGLGGLFLRRRK